MNSVVWSNYLHDTCETSFSCRITSSNIEVFFVRKGEKIVHEANYLGRRLPIEFAEDHLSDVTEGQLYISPALPDDFDLRMDCFKDEEETMCISLESKGTVGRGEVFLFDSDGRHLGDDKYIQIPSTHVQNEDDYNTALENLGKSGKVALQLGFENTQAKYNALVLANSNFRLRKFVVELVKHLSKSNPGLLGSLFKQKSWTHWINEDTVVQCPCVTVGKEESGCGGKYVYKNGNYYNRQRSDICLFPSLTVSNVTLLNDTADLSLDSIGIQSFREISIEEIDRDKTLSDPPPKVEVIDYRSIWDPLLPVLDFLRKWSFVGTLYCLYITRR